MRVMIIVITGFLLLPELGCKYDLQCERHFFVKGYTGKVVIYFNQNEGQNKLDNAGCRIYHISETGKYFCSLPINEGWGKVNTIRYFEKITQDSLIEIFEFKKEYLSDTSINKQKKYIYSISSGYTSPNYTVEYYVDYGVNFKKYSFNGTVSESFP